MRSMRMMAMLVLCLSAQALSAGNLSILAGSPFPYGRSEGGWEGQKKGGWEIGASWGTHWTDSVDVVFEAAYRQMPNAVDLSWLSSMKVLEVSANLKVRTNNQYKVVPYALLGLGLAEIGIEVDSAEAKATLSSTEVTMKLGGGIDVAASKRWGLYAEAFAWNSKYVTMIPARAGVRFTL